MDDFLEILKYTLPSVVVFLTSFYLLKTMLQNQSHKKMLEIKMGNQKVILPVRLQAYERIILFLERISPSSLVLRIVQPDMSAAQLQKELVENIRNEFEHNLSQQIYISATAWELTRSAKEETIKLINLAATKLNDHATAAQLGSMIFEITAASDKMPSANALDYVKKEVRQIF